MGQESQFTDEGESGVHQRADEIRQLVELCRAGKLFAVQEWISQGRPVNPPPSKRKGVRSQTPLEVAIDRGFHSLVEILLKGGADIEAERWNGPMEQVLQMRRLDLVQLLVDHGYAPSQVSMEAVFETWSPELMEYFIDRGADLQTDSPLANALKNRIRTALRIVKKYRDRFPHIQRQVNEALRHHCQKGDLKWVSLMLWAGADPYDTEPLDVPDESDDRETTALELAAIYRHFDIFDLKMVRIQVDHPATQQILAFALGEEQGIPLVEKLLKLGVSLNNQENGGSSAIQSLLGQMSLFATLQRHRGANNHIDLPDTFRERQLLKGIHLLARAGARWRPIDVHQISEARRSLSKLPPEYTLEFVWIMGKYAACDSETICELLRTPKMKAHLGEKSSKLRELLGKWPSDGK